MNDIIFPVYSSSITNATLSQKLTPEEHMKKREENYAIAILCIEQLCLELVSLWTSFHNSNIYWTYDETGFFHIPSQTYHETTRNNLPYYLGTSVLVEEVPSDSSAVGGKKQKKKQQSKQVLEERPQGKQVLEEKPQGKQVLEENPQANPVLEEKPQGKPVHVFRNVQPDVVFTMPIAE
jgi:hypothetical protein